MKKAFKISLVVIICLMMTFFLVGCRKEKQEETLVYIKKYIREK